VLVTPSGQSTQRLVLDRDTELDGPADIAVHRYEDGSALLLIPELSPQSRNQRDALTIVRLPAHFQQQ